MFPRDQALPLRGKRGPIKQMESSTAGMESKTDVQMRRAAFYALASVVSLTSYSGEEQKHHACGTIIHSEFDNSIFKGKVLTSTTLIRDDPGANTVIKDLNIYIRLWNRSLVRGSLLAFDLHYNIAIIGIQGPNELRAASFRLLDDSCDLDDSMNLPKKKGALELVEYGKPQKISFGDKIFILGRFHEEPFHTLMTSGEFTLCSCCYDCKELLKINGKTEKFWIGGPVVNLQGDVLGLAHYNEYFIPFLPMNVIWRLLDCYKRTGQFRHPWIGMEILNLSTTHYGGFVAFRGGKRNVVIQKVEKNSPADKAGLCSEDVILKCNDQDVVGFNDLIWDEDGEFKLKVLRPTKSEPMDFILVPEEGKPDGFNSWISCGELLVRHKHLCDQCSLYESEFKACGMD
ncbi:PDZ domain protein [Rhynchospora pubera]|uniref:PDZ domain protein n=1 Tax=Rhynchospora pubera TaxID=906938 RepID=A0AAV8GN23_9POAL|nr:PDZ domain protein [Rhynchospora pubera]